MRPTINDLRHSSSLNPLEAFFFLGSLFNVKKYAFCLIKCMIFLHFEDMVISFLEAFDYAQTRTPWSDWMTQLV